MVIALHGRAAVSDHPDSHFVALGGVVPMWAFSRTRTMSDLLGVIPANDAAIEPGGLVATNSNRREGQLAERRLLLVPNAADLSSSFLPSELPKLDPVKPLTE